MVSTVSTPTPVSQRSTVSLSGRLRAVFLSKSSHETVCDIPFPDPDAIAGSERETQALISGPLLFFTATLFRCIMVVKGDAYGYGNAMHLIPSLEWIIEKWFQHTASACLHDIAIAGF
jgi:hypothetical protein